MNNDILKNDADILSTLSSFLENHDFDVNPSSLLRDASFSSNGKLKSAKGIILTYVFSLKESQTHLIDAWEEKILVSSYEPFSPSTSYRVKSLEALSVDSFWHLNHLLKVYFLIHDIFIVNQRIECLNR